MIAHNNLLPVQLNSLTHIDDIVELTQEDNNCINEIKEVLDKYNLVSKFGIALLHRHFDVSQDEVLVEYCDEVNRVLTAKVEKSDSVEKSKLIETIWRFDTNQGKSCNRYCPSGPKGHYGYSDHG